ncbi:MAG: hypothetical protein CVU39_18220 [Chloroflexi bacterium HGW-Chloroflexi-10]|nr:MAG: hypothetical protein CVU39_18220 [Chloroflexi bacterium HGW-Chloroflexi-10]
MKLAHEKFGEGDQTLVLIHGYPLSRAIWMPMHPWLKSVQCVVVDLRGHGESLTNDYPFTMADLADDVIETLQSLNIGKFWLAGHSMGGYVSCEITQKIPDQINGFFLVASNAAAENRERIQNRYDQIEIIRNKGIEAVLSGNLDKLTADEAIKKQLEPILATTDKRTWMTCLEAMAKRRDFTTWLAEKRFPIFYLAGKQDQIMPIDFMTDQVSKIDGAEILYMESGHMPMMETPFSVASEIVKRIF